MRPLPLVAVATLLLALGFAGGLVLARPGTELVDVPTPAPTVARTPAAGGTAAVVEAAELRERVRELEDHIAELDAEFDVVDEPPGQAGTLMVEGAPRTVSLPSGGSFTGSLDGELPPDVADRIAAAVEEALGGEMDCEGDDCVLIGPDGAMIEGVEVRTMGDFDPEHMGALLQDALGDEVLVGEPSVGVMVLEAEVDDPEAE